jgi:hypothetical protein
MHHAVVTARKVKPMPARFIDLSGHVFGLLRVESYAGADERRRSLWNVVCHCGNRKVVRGDSLTTAATRSCGECKPEPRQRLRISTTTIGQGVTTTTRFAK